MLPLLAAGKDGRVTDLRQVDVDGDDRGGGLGGGGRRGGRRGRRRGRRGCRTGREGRRRAVRRAGHVDRDGRGERGRGGLLHADVPLRVEQGPAPPRVGRGAGGGRGGGGGLRGAPVRRRGGGGRERGAGLVGALAADELPAAEHEGRERTEHAQGDERLLGLGASARGRGGGAGAGPGGRRDSAADGAAGRRGAGARTVAAAIAAASRAPGVPMRVETLAVAVGTGERCTCHVSSPCGIAPKRVRKRAYEAPVFYERDHQWPQYREETQPLGIGPNCVRFFASLETCSETFKKGGGSSVQYPEVNCTIL